MITLPPYAVVNRTLPSGLHPFDSLLPLVMQSPAMANIVPSREAAAALLATAQVRVAPGQGYAYVDIQTPCIVLSEWYYRRGRGVDLYMDLLHELTHLRQLSQGMDLWDETFAYVDRATEVEGYAVAVTEGRRLGLTQSQIVQHLSNPWMTGKDVDRLLHNMVKLGFPKTAQAAFNPAA